MYLLDTNVVSELRRPRPHGAVLSWLGTVAETDLYLSVMTIGEIQVGIEVTRDRDLEKAIEIEAWLNQIIETSNILPIDAAVCRLWARFMHRRPDTLTEDAMIAATAERHGLIVATRNVRDFLPFGVKTLNPFETPS